MTRRCSEGRRSAGARGRGFTLIETMVALLIAAVGAAIVLSHVRILMLRSEREQANQLATMQVLNDSLRLAHGKPPATPPRLERDDMVIDASTEDDSPTVRIHNFSVRGEKLPPISIAYTPFQLFGVSRDRYTLAAIAPALTPPGSVMDASKPEDASFFSSGDSKNSTGGGNSAPDSPKAPTPPAATGRY